MFLCILGYCDIEPVLKMDTYGKVRGHEAKILTERCNVTSSKCFHCIIVAQGWNQLLEEAVDTKPLGTFNKKLDNYCVWRCKMLLRFTFLFSLYYIII